MITLSKIAKLANVSVSTASKAFSMSTEVNEDTRELIFSVAREQGCFKKFYNAKYPKLVIAVLCPEFESHFYASQVGHINKYLENMGCEMCVASTDFSVESQNSLLDYYSRYSNVDGIIVIDNSSEAEYRLDIPSVYVSSIDNEGRVTARKSLFEGVLEAVEYLKSKGVKEIGFIGENKTNTKQDLFLDAMKKCSLEVDERFIEITEQRFEESGFIGMSRLIEKGQIPRAIICAYDNIAVGVISCLSSHGIRVPEDVAIIGMDNVSYCDYLTPSLSSISLKDEEACNFACDTLINMILGKAYEKLRRFNSKFIPRESSEII